MARSETDPLVVTQFDEFELYDRAVVAKLVFQLENKVVPVIMGTPQRAFASVPHLYGTTSARPPLPSGVVRRTGSTNAPARGFGRKRMVVNYPTEDHGYVKVAQPPQPIDVHYNVEFWVAREQQANALIKQHHDLFVQNKTYVHVVVPEWGTFTFPVVSSDMVEATDEDAGEGDRNKRLSCTLDLEAFEFHEITLQRTVGRITKLVEVVVDVQTGD